MAGPTVLDLVEITDDIAEDDVLYVIRGTAPGRDRKVLGVSVRPKSVTQDTTGAIDLSSYQGDVVIYSNPSSNITLTFSNALPSTRKMYIVNKSTAYDILTAGTAEVVTVGPGRINTQISDGSNMYSNPVYGGTDTVIINTQAEFEQYFGTGSEVGSGTTAGGWAYAESAGLVTVTVPPGLNIICNPDPADGTTTHYRYDATTFPVKAYTLKTKLLFTYNTSINSPDAEATIIKRSADNHNFTTIKQVEKTSVTHTAGSNVVVVSANTGLKEGQKVVYNYAGLTPGQARYHTIIAISGTNITLNHTFNNSGTGTLVVMNEDIQINVVVDANGAADGMSGAPTTDQTVDMNYAYNVIFRKVINSRDNVIDISYCKNVKVYAAQMIRVANGQYMVFMEGCETCDISIEHIDGAVTSQLMWIASCAYNEIRAYHFENTGVAAEQLFRLNSGAFNKMYFWNGHINSSNAGLGQVLGGSLYNEIYMNDIDIETSGSYIGGIVINGCSHNRIEWTDIRLKATGIQYGLTYVQGDSQYNLIKGINNYFETDGTLVQGCIAAFRGTGSYWYNKVYAYNNEVNSTAGAAQTFNGAMVACGLGGGGNASYTEVWASENSITGANVSDANGLIYIALGTNYCTVYDASNNTTVGTGPCVSVLGSYNHLIGVFNGNTNNAVTATPATAYTMVGAVATVRYNDAGWVNAAR